MSEEDRRAIDQLRQKDAEVFENLRAFYNEDCLYILGEMANLTNIARMATMQGQRRLAGMICDQVAYMEPPLARLAKKKPEDVSKDLIALARARYGVIVGGGS